MCGFSVTDFSVSVFEEPGDVLTRYNDRMTGELCCIRDEASGERLGLLLILQSYQLDEEYGPVPFAQFLRTARLRLQSAVIPSVLAFEPERLAAGARI